MIDFTSEYWKGHLETTIRSMLTSRGYEVSTEEGTLHAVNSDGSDIVVVHPFWSEDYINRIIERVGGAPQPISITGLVSPSIE